MRQQEGDCLAAWPSSFTMERSGMPLSRWIRDVPNRGRASCRWSVTRKLVTIGNGGALEQLPGPRPQARA